MLKVSIIVPIYNNESYLPQCIESLIHQSLKEIEIICINDGSTDSSLDIIKKYSLKDSRIIIINQNNNGQSAARNRGIEISKGEYIAFVDSDDFIDLFTYEKAYSIGIRSNADIVMFGMNIFNSISGTKPIIEPENNIYRENVMDALFCGVGWGMCNSIFKRNLLFENNIRFAEDIKDGEDRLFANSVFPYCKCIASISDMFYYYRKDGQVSLTNGRSNSCSRIMFFILVTKRTIDIWGNIVSIKSYNKNLLERTLWLICEGAEKIEYLNENEKRNICENAARVINDDFFSDIKVEDISEISYSYLKLINAYSNQKLKILSKRR